MTSLLDLADLVRGVSYGKGEAQTLPGPGLVPIVRANNIEDGKLNFSNLQYVPAERVRDSQLLRAGDIVVAMSSGSRRAVGKAGLVIDDWQGGFGAFCGVLRPKQGVSPNRLWHFLQSPPFRAQLDRLVSGSNINNLSKARLAAVQVPKASDENQKYLANFLDASSAKKDLAVGLISSAANQMDAFRISVLLDAFSGRLTAEWRKSQSSGSLAGGLEAIASIEAEGDESKRRRTPSPLDPSANLLRTPDWWGWVSADAACSRITDGEHIQPPYRSQGYPMLTAKNIRDGYVDPQGAGLIDEQAFRKAVIRCGPREGDVLVVSVGATTGRSAVVEGMEPFAIVRSVLLLRPIIVSRFLLYWLQHPWSWEWMRQASGASAQPHLYIRDIRKMPVPVPSQLEQMKIVEAIDELFEKALSVDDLIRATQGKVERTFESVLSKVFQPAALASEEGGQAG